MPKLIMPDACKSSANLLKIVLTNFFRTFMKMKACAFSTKLY